MIRKEYQQLCSDCLKCKRCILHEERNRVVFGSSENSLSSKVMFIGEAPGAEEDRLGVPFVGSSGKMLGSILKSISINRDDVYITNAVKCRPPYNRVPTQSELDTCFKWLSAEIKLVKPTVIISLGTIATSCMFDLMGLFVTGISKRRGEQFKTEIYGRKTFICPTFHPSYVLRNKDILPVVRQDIKNAFLLLR